MVCRRTAFIRYNLKKKKDTVSLMKEKHQYNVLPNANAIRNNIYLWLCYMTFGLAVLTYCTKPGFSLLQKIRL